MSQRIVKIDRNNKSILIRALHVVYRQRKSTGQDHAAEGRLILRINEVAGGRLSLSEEEYHTARSALNAMRNEQLAIGGCTDALDDALYKLLKARQLFSLFCL